MSSSCTGALSAQSLVPVLILWPAPVFCSLLANSTRLVSERGFVLGKSIQTYVGSSNVASTHVIAIVFMLARECIKLDFRSQACYSDFPFYGDKRDSAQLPLRPQNTTQLKSLTLSPSNALLAIPLRFTSRVIFQA